MFEEILKRFKKIKPEKTFSNNYANSLLVMLNHIKNAIDSCDDTEVKETLMLDFIKYENILENELQ